MALKGERAVLLREANRVVDGLAKTFAPYCEVVLHDLTTPEHAIVRIENNLSGRSVGDSATELGLARIADPQFPDVIANYENILGDGRRVKSTSIGLKDSSGVFVAAICLNLDTSYFESMISYLRELVRTERTGAPVLETLAAHPGNLEEEIARFAARRNVPPRLLSPGDRRELIVDLQGRGFFQMRGAVKATAQVLGMSRTALYHYLDRPGGGSGGARGSEG